MEEEDLFQTSSPQQPDGPIEEAGGLHPQERLYSFSVHGSVSLEHTQSSRLSLREGTGEELLDEENSVTAPSTGPAVSVYDILAKNERDKFFERLKLDCDAYDDDEVIFLFHFLSPSISVLITKYLLTG